MAINPSFHVSPTWRDQSGEISSMKINLAAPIDMTSLPLGYTELLTEFDNELINGLLARHTMAVPLIITNVAEGGGNREDKLLMTYEDSVTLKVYQSELPCRLPTLTTVGVGSDSVPPATWAQTKIKWDAFVKSIDGNATVLIDVEIIGRNV